MAIEKKKVLLVDDHPIFRAGLRMLLETNEELLIIGEADDRASAIAVASRERPDLILLDLDLNGSSGLDFLPDLLTLPNPPKIIILTGMLDSEMHKRAIQLGARGLVLKNEVADDLILAIKSVNQGNVWFNPALLWQMIPKMSRESEAKKPDLEEARISTLTKRELEVISLITKGMKNQQIAETLFISEATVRHHLTSIFSKLGRSDRFELVVYAYQQGLAKPQPNQP
jgi:DNA-binding NarL/FixJ family response regulator